LRQTGRLVSRSDYAKVYREGRRYSGAALVMYVKAGDGPLRVGVTAGRKLGGAVRRNRAKRRLREAFRRLQGRLSGQGDVILAARSRVLSAAFPEIVEEMEALCTVGRLMRERDR
jgi:ribonuclease P protein component